MNQNRVILVTGMSGAGRNFTLKTLEDIGYETVDNLPLSFLSLIINPDSPLLHPLAIGIDVRTRDFSTTQFLEQIKTLGQRDNVQLEIVFCDCDDDVLARRYTESRRKHPLSSERPALDGIRAERMILKPILPVVTYTLDTTYLSITETRQILRHQFSLERNPQTFIQIVSFGFKHGMPRESDMVLDVRFLKNPYYDEQLRPFSGEDLPVAQFIENDPLIKPFIDQIKSTLSLMLPRFDEEGRSYFTLAFGCTGGQHRSVYCAQTVYNWLKHSRHQMDLRHRDRGIASKQERSLISNVAEAY
jgi:UPF0042 nucleotide-binding protein